MTEHAYSVATLLLHKSTRFHNKKTLDSQKNTRLEKQTYTQCKYPEIPTIDIVQLIVNQRQRKREMAATLVFICTGH